MRHKMRVALRRLGQHPLQLAEGALGIGVNVALFGLGLSKLFKPLELRQLGGSWRLYRGFSRGEI